MVFFGLRVNSSGMPIGSRRPRLGSIDRSTMPYNSSRGVHQRPKQNTWIILRMEDCHIFGVQPKSLHPEKPDEEFAKTWKNLDLPVIKKQSMLHTMGIVRTFVSKVNSSKMSIGSCSPKSRLIDWSAMPYSSSRGVHPRPKQNNKRFPHLWGEAKIVSPPKTRWTIYKNLQEIHIRNWQLIATSLVWSKNHFTPKNLMSNL